MKKFINAVKIFLWSYGLILGAEGSRPPEFTWVNR